MPKIYIIDDDKNYLRSVSNLLSYKNYQVFTESNPHTALETYKEQSFDCVLLDVKMPGINGIDLLKSFLKTRPFVPVIMISGNSTISLAMEAVRLGAFDFIEKPLDPNRLLVSLQNAIERQTLFIEKEELLSQLDEKYRLVGSSPEMQAVYAQIRQVARSKAKVLITGESGTGKELVARAIHAHSDRNTRPLVKLNCAAIPPELLESELFGHKKGVFTGATESHKGKFAIADKGTLFLDEIGDLELRLQSKLLRALQEGEIEVLGEATPRAVDVRVIAATNRDLKSMMKEGRFREDLYHRLNVVQIHLPPLRAHARDIPELAFHFLQEYAQSYNKPISKISNGALHLMEQYDWPGNTRELQHFMEKLVIFKSSGQIEVRDVQKAFANSDVDKETFTRYQGPLDEARDSFERDYIRTQLLANNGHIQKTADMLGINRTTLFKKMRRLGIEKD